MKKLILLFILLPLCCFAQTRPHWIDIKGKPLIDVREFGAISGDNVDDTAAIQAAENYAKANGGAVLIEGTYYLASSTGIIMKADTYGAPGNLIYAATQTATVSMYSDSSAPNVIIDGLNTECVNFDLGYGATIQNCSISKVENFGIRLQGATLACRAINNRISDVIYGEAGSADGIYTAGVVSCVIEKNIIHNIRRIGIVVEANSKHVTAQDNIVYDANNSGDSVGEYNAGLWAENSADVFFLRNKVYDVVGQTNSPRAWGIVMTSNFQKLVGSNTMILEDNVLDEGLILLGQGGGNFSVKNNRFENSNILIKGCDPSISTSNVFEIANNYIGGTSDNFANSKIWFEGVQDNDDKLIVTENEFEGTISGDGGHVLMSPAIARFLTVKDQPQPLYFHNRSSTTNALGATALFENSNVQIATTTVATVYPRVRAYNNITVNNCYWSGHDFYLDGPSGRGRWTNSEIVNTQMLAYVSAGSSVEVSNSWIYGQVQPLLLENAALKITDTVFVGQAGGLGAYNGNIYGLLSGSSASSTIELTTNRFLTSDPASTTYAIDGDGKTQPALRTVMFGNTHNHDGLLIGWPAAIATYSIVVP